MCRVHGREQRVTAGVTSVARSRRRQQAGNSSRGIGEDLTYEMEGSRRERVRRAPQVELARWAASDVGPRPCESAYRHVPAQARAEETAAAGASHPTPGPRTAQPVGGDVAKVRRGSEFATMRHLPCKIAAGWYGGLGPSRVDAARSSVAAIALRACQKRAVSERRPQSRTREERPVRQQTRKRRDTTSGSSGSGLETTKNVRALNAWPSSECRRLPRRVREVTTMAVRRAHSAATPHVSALASRR